MTFGGEASLLPSDPDFQDDPTDFREVPLEDIHTLNLQTMELNEVKATGVVPFARRGHSACLTKENQILMFGGYNVENKQICNDLSMMYVSEGARKKVFTACLKY